MIKHDVGGLSNAAGPLTTGPPIFVSRSPIGSMVRGHKFIKSKKLSKKKIVKKKGEKGNKKSS